MSRNDIVRRTQEAAWRSANAVPETLERDRYEEECDAIGRNMHSAPELKSAYRQIQGTGDFLTHWLVIVLLSLTMFAAILGVLLWRDGAFDHLIARGRGPIIDRSWMRGASDAPGAAATSSPAAAATEDSPPNEIEKLLNPSRPQPEGEPAGSETDSDAETTAE